MNFQYINKISPAQEYLDRALSSANKQAKLARQTKIKQSRYGVLDKSRLIETEKLKTIESVLTKPLKAILTEFPAIRDLPEFYQQLLKLNIDIFFIRKSLGSIQWTVDQVYRLTKKQTDKIRRATSVVNINAARREYYGRIGSIMRQINEYLQYAEEVRKVLRTFPDIKLDAITIALAGLPNVGKSSLLKSLTNASPEIKEYPFTTKSLNSGFIKTPIRTYQLIDTPGTLSRSLEKSNSIEKQSFLVLELLAEKIAYIFDPTETCGYTIEDQMQVFCNMLAGKAVKEKHLEIIIVLNKADQQANRREELLVKLEQKQKDLHLIWPIFNLSAKNKEGTEQLKELLLKYKPREKSEFVS